MRLARYLSVVIGTGALLTAAISIAGPGVAAAATVNCNPSVQNNSSGVYEFESSDTYLGPAKECGMSLSVVQTTVFYEHCRVDNAYGNTWLYGRIDGTTDMVWVPAVGEGAPHYLGGTSNEC